MRDIASHVGVSVMSISRALSGEHPKVSAKLRAKVLAAAEQMGYRPDPALSALVSYRHQKAGTRHGENLAFLTSWDSATAWMSIHHYRLVFEGASQRAAELGYRLEHFWLRETGLRQRRAGDILYHRGIRGLLIAPLQVNIGHLRMEWARFAAVTLGYSLVAPALHYVVTDYFAGVFLAWKRLRAQGYRRIGLAIGRRHDTRTQHRWRAAFEILQMQVPVRRRIPSMIDEAGLVKEPFDAWFDRYRPDAVLSLGPGIPDWIREHGFRVPEEVGYVDLDVGGDECESGGVYQNARHQGAAATEILHLELLRFQSGLPQVRQGVVVAPVWKPGATVRGGAKERDVTPG